MTTATQQNEKFDLGEVFLSRNAYEQLHGADIRRALSLHARGDWGMVDPEDWAANDRALKENERLLSVYKSEGGEKFWIITELDRSVTTVLFPDDY